MALTLVSKPIKFGDGTSGTGWFATDGTNMYPASVLLDSNGSIITDNAGMPVANVAGTAIIGKVGIDQTTPGTTNAVAVKGVYTAAGITLTDGQRAEAQFDSAGHLLVANQVALGGQTPTNSAPTVNADQYGQYETVAASQTAQALGATGATGDYLAGVLVFPGTAACGVVTVLDNATAIGTFAGGGTTALPSLVPFLIPVGLFSVSGAWKITTGANVTAVGIGKFT